MANDSLQKKSDVSMWKALYVTAQVSWQYHSYAHNTPHQIILYHAPQLPRDKMQSYYRVPPYVRATSPPLPQDWHDAL